MKLTTMRYIFKEGLLNVFRNKLMFFACSAIITAALVILGIFMLIIINIEDNIEMLKEIPQIQVYCRSDLSDDEVLELENTLRDDPGIREFVVVSKQEAFEKAKQLLEEDGDTISGLGDDFLPVSFIVAMDSPDMIEEYVGKAEELDGVDKIYYPKHTIDTITAFSNWTKIVGAVLIIIPMLFAFFIMSNTIKLAVAERQTEISIMRYIGATEQLIKWPFVIEGVVIGLIGASIAYMITGYGYSIAENSFNSLAFIASNPFKLIKIGNASTTILTIYTIIGGGVGAIGSVQSIRKYLRV